LKASKKLRKIHKALLDHYGPQNWWPGDTPFEVAVGAILTQNTNWGNVERAIANLKKTNSLNPMTLLKMPQQEVALQIKPSGYNNIKAERLREFLNFLVKNYKGSMNNMRKEPTHSLRERLLDVKGIGPETADSMLLYALEKPVFVIDAYTKRVLSRHGIVRRKAAYHEVQEIFHKHLPADTSLFNEYHALFVKLGKDFCKPEPKCHRCPLEHFVA